MAEVGIKTIHLSKQACSLWAKSDYGAGEGWLPLYMHMFDSAAVAERLWDAWVPESTKRIVARSLGDDGIVAKRIAIFLVAVHDIGKATPIFQA